MCLLEYHWRITGVHLGSLGIIKFHLGYHCGIISQCNFGIIDVHSVNWVLLGFVEYEWDSFVTKGLHCGSVESHWYLLFGIPRVYLGIIRIQ